MLSGILVSMFDCRLKNFINDKAAMSFVSADILFCDKFSFVIAVINRMDSGIVVMKFLLKLRFSNFSSQKAFGNSDRRFSSKLTDVNDDSSPNSAGILLILLLCMFNVSRLALFRISKCIVVNNQFFNSKVEIKESVLRRYRRTFSVGRAKTSATGEIIGFPMKDNR